MTQNRTNGTVIPVGGTTDETFILFSARVSDPDLNQVQLQVEARQVGTSFVSALGTSALVPSGSTAWALITLPVAGSPGVAGSYHVQMRTRDANGAVSDWVSFGGNLETDADFVATWTGLTGSAPGAPSAINQFRSDGVTVIAVGGTTAESRVIIKATATDPDPASGYRLQVERKNTTVAFTGSGFVSSDFVASGTEAVVQLTGLAAGGHHWQYRLQDGHGNFTGWTAFGTDPTFTVSGTNTAPGVPTGPGQFTTSDGTIVAGGTTQESTVRFKATVTDPDAGDGVRLQIEVRPLGVAFLNQVSGESALLASGSLASIDVSGLANGDYHWQYRTIDGTGATSAWTAFSGGTDFTVAVPSGGGGGGGGGGCGCTGLEPIVLFAILLRRRRK